MVEIIKLNEKLIDYQTPHYFVIRVSHDIEDDLKTGFTSWKAYPTLRTLIQDGTGWMVVDEVLERRKDYVDQKELLGMSEKELENFLENRGLIPDYIRQRASGWWGIYHYDGLACWQLHSNVVGDAIYECCERFKKGKLLERKFYPSDVVRIIDLSVIAGVFKNCDFSDTYLIEVKDTYFDPRM